MDLNSLWLQALQEVVGLAAHEVKDSLNGVSLNLEVIRSRSERDDLPSRSLSSFAAAASDQFELLSARTESVLFLARPQKGGAAVNGPSSSAGNSAGGPADVALTLKHLATLLVPAMRADGGFLDVDGYELSAPTAAAAPAVRLALAAGLLALARAGGSSRCRLELGAETVVRFSHESAGNCSLDPAIAKVLAEHHIRLEQSESDLAIVFPGT